MMFRYLLASTAVLAISAPAMAEDIATAKTAPLLTSTVKNGAPDAINVTTAGSVVLTSGTAITMDSNHAVTNGGALTISGANGARGIVANAGTSGAISNSGTIALEESYTPVDTDNDGNLDGPFAMGSDKIGIATLGAHTGAVTNTGTIKIKGNNSTGISLGGPLTGALTQNGTISVIGDNGVGLSAGDITGNVRLAGTVAVQGENSVAARFDGDIEGTMEVQGVISSTGYRYTTVPSNVAALDPDDLLQGGSALVIAGDVSKGIVLAIAPADKDTADNDEDDDGIEDSKEGNARVQSFGEAPAMVIGATDRAIEIGSVPGLVSGYGVVINGTVAGSGLYKDVDGNGLVIGGQGGAVSVEDGLGIYGGVAATSLNATATALRIGADATVPVVYNAGSITAASGSTADSVAYGIVIDDGANVPKIHNTGAIKATVTGDAGLGSATAIIDRSGDVLLVENAGSISASGAKADSTRNIAIDLSANTSGATVRQTQVGTGFTAPFIAGDIRFGTGDDVLDIADGSVNGTVTFGAGANRLALSGDAIQAGAVVFGSGLDTMTLGGTSLFLGTVDFGGGADTLTLNGTARFSGSFTNAADTAVAVNGGVLSITKSSTIGSLNVGAAGTLAVTLSKEVTQNTGLIVEGTAAFADGATLALQLANIADAEGRYTIVQAESLQGAAKLKTTTDFIPYMFSAKLATNAPANTLAVDVARKTTTELGLNRSQATAFGAILDALGEDEEIEDIFLGITNGDVFKYSVRQMLPDHAGGAFEGVSLGSRTLARQMSDPLSPVYSLGGLDIIINVAGWGSDKAENDTAAYELAGFGGTLAGEFDTKIGAFGVAANWFWNEYDEGGDANRVLSDTYELAAYWRGNWGGFNGFARASYGMVDFSGRRTFVGLDGQTRIERNTLAEWKGTLTTLTGGMSYEFGSGSVFLRPTVTADYVRLSEDGYTETGGKGLNLTVADRKSDEFGVNAGLATGIDFVGKGRGDNRWFRTEAEGGWREVVGGTLGSTTASFEDGEEFTLAAEQQSSGWYGRLRVMGGSRLFEIGGELGAEKRHESTAYSLRGSIRMGF